MVRIFCDICMMCARFTTKNARAKPAPSSWSHLVPRMLTGLEYPSRSEHTHNTVISTIRGSETTSLLCTPVALTSARSSAGSAAVSTLHSRGGTSSQEGSYGSSPKRQFSCVALPPRLPLESTWMPNEQPFRMFLSKKVMVAIVVAQ